MRERNPNPQWSIVVGTSILLILAALPTSGQESKRRANPDICQVKWDCLKRRDILRKADGQLRWFSSSELMERIIDKQPVHRPGGLGKTNLRGIVTIQVVIDKDGNVICTRGVKGNPLGIASAVRSLPKWTFRPYVIGGKKRSIVGTLSIPYNFGG